MDTLQIGTGLVAGVVGGIAMLAVIYGGKASGMTSMDLLKMLGSMMAPRAESNVQYGVGAMMHLMMSAVFGVVHAALLVAVDPATVSSAISWDLVFGAAHGAMIIVALPMMVGAMHPLVRTGEMAAPGAFMTGYGKMTPMGALMGHVAFGLVTGGIYAASVL